MIAPVTGGEGRGDVKVPVEDRLFSLVLALLATETGLLKSEILSTVRGYAELYRQGAVPDSAAVGQAMERIEKEAIRMGGLVEDLLALARLDEAKPLELAEVDLEHLREWIWQATQRGDARSTIARRTAAVRGLFAWAVENEIVSSDPSARLTTPKRGRTLPKVALAPAMGEVLDGLAASATGGERSAMMP